MKRLLDPINYIIEWAEHQKLRGTPNKILTSLRLESFRNKHGNWGWYEIRPLGMRVGYWGEGKDDLAGVDVADWNKKAKETLERYNKLKAFT